MPCKEKLNLYQKGRYLVYYESMYYVCSLKIRGIDIERGLDPNNCYILYFVC